MSAPPESPDGYTEYEPYTLPKPVVRAAILVTGVIFTLWLWLWIKPVITLEVHELIDIPIAILFGLTGGLLLHEGCHYYMDIILGYEPCYAFPNRVFVPNEPFETGEAIYALLAPQLLTIGYLALAFLMPSDSIIIMLAGAIGYNFVGGSKDFAWVYRRISWPSRHLVLVDESENTYVAFDESNSSI